MLPALSSPRQIRYNTRSAPADSFPLPPLLLHPGKGTLARLNSTPDERSAREAKLADAVRTLLECIGEDPERDGLIKTPERYAKALLWMTKGYEERLPGECCWSHGRRLVRRALGLIARIASSPHQMSLAMPFSPRITTRWSSFAISTFSPSASTTWCPSLARSVLGYPRRSHFSG